MFGSAPEQLERREGGDGVADEDVCRADHGVVDRSEHVALRLTAERRGVNP